MFQNLSGWHFVILLVIILLLFGAPRLPALARSLGQSFRILKGEVKQSQAEDEVASPSSAAQPSDAAAPTTTTTTSTVDHSAEPRAGQADAGEPTTRP